MLLSLQPSPLRLYISDSAQGNHLPKSVIELTLSGLQVLPTIICALLTCLFQTLKEKGT